MDALILWKRLTETDFNAMHGKASPHGRGGGAMHIALGVCTDTFPIDKFLASGRKKDVKIMARADKNDSAGAPLAFTSNPSRRGGEWLIRDQFSHRHKAWTTTYRFPENYDPQNPPYILIFRVGKMFHARFSTIRQLKKLGRPLADNPLLTSHKGIEEAPEILLREFQIPMSSLVETLEQFEIAAGDDAFDPRNVADGRNRVLAAIVRRLGQQAFRRKLFTAYDGQCAFSRCNTKWVLEAAHITPYRGLKTNAVSNGLLLRADLHTLFDLGLLSIDPGKLKVRVSGLLKGSIYMGLNGKEPLIPRKESARPSQAALEDHFRLFKWN